MNYQDPSAEDFRLWIIDLVNRITSVKGLRFVYSFAKAVYDKEGA